MSDDEETPFSPAIVPHDILKLMEKEYSDMCMIVIAEICDQYSLCIHDVKKTLRKKLGMTFEIDLEKNNYRYVKRKPDTCTIENEKRCAAVMYDQVYCVHRRCRREQYFDKSKGEYISIFCSTHQRMARDGRLDLYGVAEGYETQWKKEEAELKAKGDAVPHLAPPKKLKKQVVRKVK